VDPGRRCVLASCIPVKSVRRAVLACSLDQLRSSHRLDPFSPASSFPFHALAALAAARPRTLPFTSHISAPPPLRVDRLAVVLVTHPSRSAERRPKQPHAVCPERSAAAAAAGRRLSVGTRIATPHDVRNYTATMRRQTPIANLLYEALYPPHSRTPNDPPSFSAHLARNLVPEVRIEVATFYGDLNSTEARYPGLNYCYPPHRMRLGRFKHHRRLFEAFDNLGLTYNEIQDFCCWEGTKWARERYEKDEGIKVLDTTGDDIGPFVDRREVRAADEQRRKSITRQTDISVIVEVAEGAPSSDPVDEDADMSDVGSDGEDDTETVHEPPSEAIAREEHIAELNRRREQAINQRIIAAWEQGQSLPPEIEQYLKEQSERGTLSAGLDLRSLLNSNRATSGYALLPATTETSRSATAPVTGRAAA